MKKTLLLMLVYCISTTFVGAQAPPEQEQLRINLYRGEVTTYSNTTGGALVTFSNKDYSILVPPTPGWWNGMLFNHAVNNGDVPALGYYVGLAIMRYQDATWGEQTFWQEKRAYVGTEIPHNNDTFKLMTGVLGSTDSIYTFEMQTTFKLGYAARAKLEDLYTGTVTDIPIVVGDTGRALYKFQLTMLDAPHVGSRYFHRFRIVVSNNVSFARSRIVNAAATFTSKKSGTTIKWNTRDEGEVASYEVQKLIGRRFVSVKQVSLYERKEVFMVPSEGEQKFRIKANLVKGGAVYSDTLTPVLVRDPIVPQPSGFTAFPMVITNRTTLHFDQDQGRSNVVVARVADGRVVQTSSIIAVGNVPLVLKSLSAGAYVVKVIPSKGNPMTQQILVQ